MEVRGADGRASKQQAAWHLDQAAYAARVLRAIGLKSHIKQVAFPNAVYKAPRALFCSAADLNHIVWQRWKILLSIHAV